MSLFMHIGLFVTHFISMYVEKSGDPLISRAHSFREKNSTNSATHRGKADEIPRLIADTQLNVRGLIKSWINRSNTCYELSFIHFGHFYSAPSSHLPLRGAPDYSTDTVSEFHAKAHIYASFIIHQFHHSTITIKQKIIINKLVTELLWGHFLWKNSCSNEKRQIPRTDENLRKTVGPTSQLYVVTKALQRYHRFVDITADKKLQ